MSGFSVENIGENIGAFELNGVMGVSHDATLEVMAIDPGKPTARGWTGFCCGRIDDDVVETAAAFMAGPSSDMACYSTSRLHCRHIDDGALEAGPVNPLPPTIACPRHIDDGALEASAMMSGHPSQSPVVCPVTQLCRHIDDGMLEAVGAMTANPSYDMVCMSTVGSMCRRRIDDGVLEASAYSAGPGPFTKFPCAHVDDDGALEASANPQPPRPVFTRPPFCKSIDDAALEASANPNPPSTIPLVLCRRIDDGALEASADPRPMPPAFTRPPMCNRIDAISAEDAALEASVAAGPQRLTLLRSGTGRCIG